MRKKKVLVIDGNPEYLNMMIDALKEEDIYAVRSADNGKAGLQIIKGFHPDLVVLEIFLRDISGFRIISELKSDPAFRDIPVIALTAAFVGGFEQGKGFKIGKNRYFHAAAILYKPFDEDLFLDKIEEVLFDEKTKRMVTREKVLIVDDDPQICKLLDRILKKENYETIYAENGKEGLEKIETERPDIVFSDLMMPEMSGMAMLEKALHINQDLPVIMITAQGSEAKAVKLMKMGAVDYIRKPFNNEEILVRARECLKNARVAAAEKRFQRRIAETTNQLVLQLEKAEANPYGKRHIVAAFLATLIGSLIGFYFMN